MVRGFFNRFRKKKPAADTGSQAQETNKASRPDWTRSYGLDKDLGNRRAIKRAMDEFERKHAALEEQGYQEPGENGRRS